MAIDLVTKYLPYVDELFAKESKKDLLTNNDFEWTGAHTVKIYTVTTAAMNDYGRTVSGYGTTGSRYGAIQTLDATTVDFTLRKDRSFTFAIDKLDQRETGDALEAASALARQQRQVVIPEVDTYVYGIMAAGAGTKPSAVTLTSENIYDEIIKASEALDDALVPENERVLVVAPWLYTIMKRCTDISHNGDIGTELRVKGVVGFLDGSAVIKVPASRLPENFGFMLCHPCATVAPTQLEEYKVHEDPPGISGSLVEGRICYDAYVIPNKNKAIYYQANLPD